MKEFQSHADRKRIFFSARTEKKPTLNLNGRKNKVDSLWNFWVNVHVHVFSHFSIHLLYINTRYKLKIYNIRNE